jgi:hypothetical protein
LFQGPFARNWMRTDMIRPNPAEEKARIDRGADGDKVPGFDPGAAPLGTDEEAAGTPYIPDSMVAARRGPSPRPPAGQTPAPGHSIAPDADPTKPRGHWGLAAAMLAIAIIVAVIVWWAKE